MSRYFVFGSFLLFALIGMLGWWKRSEKPKEEIPLVQEIPLSEWSGKVPSQEELREPDRPSLVDHEGLPDADRISRLFALDSSKLPFVETISYTSRVPWLKGRPAWLTDYAAHFFTSKHFIARSLNQSPDYLKQNISLGDRFNVFRLDKEICFYLVADLSRCRLWFYLHDLDADERILLKTYPIGVGRLDSDRTSGCLTPVGVYRLGDKIAIYRPGTMGFFQGEKTEMIQVFGTRWVPFSEEVDGCSEPAKGLGLHGLPWKIDSKTGEWLEDMTCLGAYGSDGCIRLSARDMEEIFSIIITKKTDIEIVQDFSQAHLPGKEWQEDERDGKKPLIPRSA